MGLFKHLKETREAIKRTLDVRLVRSAEFGDLDAVKKHLKEGASINGRDTNGDTALIGAARENQSDMVSFLLSKGADASLTNNFNKTALHTALFDHADEALCKKLIKPGRDYSGQDMHGNPAVFYTAQYGQIEVLDALAAAGADLAQKGRGGTTPLMCAIAVYQKEAIDRLLGNEYLSRAGIDAQDDEGNTPLAVAVINHREDIALSLIALGANIDLKNKQGQTPRALAEELGFHDIGQAIDEASRRKYAATVAEPVRTMKTISLKPGASA